MGTSFMADLALHALLVTVMLLTTLLTPFSVRPAAAQEPVATPLPDPATTLPPPIQINPKDLVAPPDVQPAPPVPDVAPYTEPAPPEVIPQAGPAVYTPTTPLTVTLSATLPPQGYVDTFASSQAGSIFPGVAWGPAGAGGALGYTPTLLAITERGVAAAAALPATSFVYGDGMHLTEARNGYGVVKFEYDAEPTTWTYNPTLGLP